MSLPPKLLAALRKNLKGISESAMGVMVWDGQPDETREYTANYIQFLMQMGHMVMSGKPLIVPVPHGVEVPGKLLKIADAIVRFDPKDPMSMQDAMSHVLSEMVKDGRIKKG